MFGFLGWIVLGFVLGLAARLIIPPNSDGVLLRVLIGVAGAVLGGVLTAALGVFDYGQPGLILFAALGSVGALLLYRLTTTGDGARAKM